jgi:hypothetical protein
MEAAVAWYASLISLIVPFVRSSGTCNTVNDV